MTDRFKSGLSFRTRITAAAMATALSVLLVACALFTLEQWGGERAMFLQMQKTIANAVAVKLAETEPKGPAAQQAVLGALSMAPRVAGGAFVDPQGHVLARYQGPTGLQSGAGALVVTRAPVKAGGRVLGEFVLAARAAKAGSFLPRYLAITGALFFAATALSLFLGRLLAQRVIEPIERLSAVMEEVAVSGDLGRRVTRVENDEFGGLTESFNALLDRLNVNDQELRRTLQALVLARDAAEAANVQKSQFLANMSHEIRTPLNGVLAMAQIMALGDLEQEQRERLDVIRTSGEALLTILNDILDVSKIEAGKLELEVAEFDLERLVKATAGGFRAVADGKGLALAVDVDPGAADGLRVGDAARVRQILSNLVSNALKFTSRGRVSILVEATGDQGADGVRLTVADTGIGMAEDKLPLLFQKFTQLDASTTRRFGGTGLGLAICRELTEKMGGTIRADSVEGQGSVFVVELPLPRAESPVALEEDEDALPEDQGRLLRVLAAEDNVTNQKVLATILEMFGVDLQIVENGRLAVEAWNATDPDIILMDIQMPEMDGIAAARAIRKAEASAGRARTPIIALSANAMSHQVEEYLAAGMDGHVAKPIELTKLHAALEWALQAKEAARAAA
jgi:signal transduction histidine kinase/ActR/RegA family two-component response regulator